jgi:twitching motility protein PilU
MLSALSLFTEMKRLDASDLYLTIGRPPSFRVNGVVQNWGENKLTEAELLFLTKELLNQKQFEEFEQTKEQNLAVCYPELGRFRINAYIQKGQIAHVIRKIETQIKTLDELSLPSTLKDISMTKRGLILVVGATGSGKSTTLAAMIDHRNRNEAGHIITIEDPIEFVHEHQKCVVSQREVGMDTDSFKTALKNTLRQAPTVILIGEIRDEQTMEYALEFAETGHLCLATLHSNNANQTMERVINFFPPERHKQVYLQLSLNLRGIISQRLVKTPQNGRAAAIEILLGSARVKELIKKGEVESLKEAMITGAPEGMQTFDEALFILYKTGKISEAEALANSDAPTDLKLKIKLSSGNINFSGENSSLQFAPEPAEA